MQMVNLPVETNKLLLVGASPQLGTGCHEVRTGLVQAVGNMQNRNRAENNDASSSGKLMKPIYDVMCVMTVVLLNLLHCSKILFSN